MAYEQKNNSGSLFKNDRKEKESHPDYKGSAVIEGQEYWISAWVKTSKNGQKFFSFSFKEKEVQQPKDYAPGNRSPNNPSMKTDDFEDDIPFS